MSNNQEDPRTEVREIERLRNENAILRSLIHEKVQCTICSADDSVRKQLAENQQQLTELQKQLGDSRNLIEALQTEMAELKVKQQADTDTNKNIIEKLRVRISKQTRDKQAKGVQMNPVVESAPKTDSKKPVPEAAPPVPPAPSAPTAPSAPPASSKVPEPPAPSAPSAPSRSSAPHASSKVSEAAAAPSAPSRSPAPHASPKVTEAAATSAPSKSPALHASSKVSEAAEPSAPSKSAASPEPPTSTEVSEPPVSSALSTASEPTVVHSVPPKPRSLHEKFAGIWKITSTKDCDHYINFQKLDKNEYLSDLDIECDGTHLQIPPEPEVIANPFLNAETRFENDNLLTVLRKEGGEKIDDIVITRTLKSDDQMVIKTVLNAFYNLTHSRQVISCTRVYDRVA